MNICAEQSWQVINCARRVFIKHSASFVLFAGTLLFTLEDQRVHKYAKQFLIDPRYVKTVVILVFGRGTGGFSELERGRKY